MRSLTEIHTFNEWLRKDSTKVTEKKAKNQEKIQKHDLRRVKEMSITKKEKLAGSNAGGIGNLDNELSLPLSIHTCGTPPCMCWTLESPFSRTKQSK